MLGSTEECAVSGGIAFESFPRVKRVSDKNRAYLIGDTIEQPRQADAPAAAAKVYEGEMDDSQIAQKSFVAVSTCTT